MKIKCKVSELRIEDSDQSKLICFEATEDSNVWFQVISWDGELPTTLKGRGFLLHP